MFFCRLAEHDKYQVELVDSVSAFSHSVDTYLLTRAVKAVYPSEMGEAVRSHISKAGHSARFLPAASRPGLVGQ